MDTARAGEAVAGKIVKADVAVAADLTPKVKVLWEEITHHVPPPKPADTALGPIKGQELVEHVNHSETSQGDTLEWTYEIMLDRNGITPKPQVFERVPLADLSPKSRETVAELDALTTRTVNQRYVDAMQRLSK